MKKLIFAVLSFILVACSNQSIEEGLDDLNLVLNLIPMEHNDNESDNEDISVFKFPF